MPLPKVRTGRLAPDQEALDYYNVPVKHWTQTDWNQMDMDYLDVGLHTDPTPQGFQAASRRDAVKDGWFPGKQSGLGDDATKDLRIHIGRELHVSRDPGTWDKPDDARMALSEAAYDAGEMELRDALDALELGNGSTIVTFGDARQKVLDQMQSIRDVMKKYDYDTVSYVNEEEGIEAAIDAAMLNPERLAHEASELDRARDLRMQAVRAERDGDYELGEQLDMEATDIEDGLEMARDEIRRDVEEGNISYISLDPGNVRDAKAAFQKDMIGKPDMYGQATVPFLGGLAGLGATGAYLASQGLPEAAGEIPQALANLGRSLWNDAQEGGRRLQRGLTGTDIGESGRLDAGTPTGLGQAVGTDIGNYIAGIDLNPFPGEYTVGQALGDAGEFIEGLDLSPRQEDVLGGGALLASMIGLPGKKTVVADTVDTRLGKQTAAANTKSLENQATRVREDLAQQGGYQTVAEDVVDLETLPVLTRKDLEGGVFMPTAGDRTMHGKLKRSSGIEVDTDLQGGPGYGALYNDWESTADIANSYQNKVGQVAEAAGTDKVFGTYSPMRLPSANFSTMPAEVAAQQVQTLLGAGARYNPKLVDEINRTVAESGGKKKPNRDFPGILSPDAEAFLAQRGSAAVNARKAMLGEMQKAPYRDAGFPLVEQIYRDVSYPELHNRDIGEAGDLILRLDPNAPTRTSDWHKSYGTIIPSQGPAGRLAGTAPFSTIYRDGWNQLEGVMTESKLNKKGEWTTPRLLNQLEKTNTINWNKPQTEGAKTRGFQMIDDQLLDELERLGLLAP